MSWLIDCSEKVKNWVSLYVLHADTILSVGWWLRHAIYMPVNKQYLLVTIATKLQCKSKEANFRRQTCLGWSVTTEARRKLCKCDCWLKVALSRLTVFRSWKTQHPALMSPEATDNFCCSVSPSLSLPKSVNYISSSFHSLLCSSIHVCCTFADVLGWYICHPACFTN